MELCDYTATKLAGMLKTRKVSSREITEDVLKRIKEKEADINSFITVLDEEKIFAQADEADRRISSNIETGPLNGIPIAIKDNICTKNILTTCASKMLSNYVPPYSATAVDLLLKEGAVCIGKTNMDEFAMGASSETSVDGVTFNPANSEYVAGGSSSGSAAAVATGETVISIGSDTGGSIRQPSSFCGVVGMKPTYGRVSRYGLISYGSSLDQIGPIARSVEDCAMVLNTICGHDPMDSTSANIQTPDFTKGISTGINGLHIGVPKEFFTEDMDPEVKRLNVEAIDVLRRKGAEIIDISLPHTLYGVATYYIIATAEASSNLACFDGAKYGFRAAAGIDDDMMSMREKTRSEGFGFEVKRRIILGCYMLSAGYHNAYYIKAQKVRNLIRQDFYNAFEKVDCIVAPVCPTGPFKIGEKINNPVQMYLTDIYNVTVNLAGLPAMSVPCGTASNGLPLGFQIIGRPFDEETVLRVGYAYECI